MIEIVPERLQAAMTRAGINQTQLADAVGLKQPSIARLLSGETRTSRAIERIARVLGTTVNDLRGRDAEVARSEGDHPPAYSDLGNGLASHADTIDLDEIDLRYGLGGTFMDNQVETRRRPFSRAWLRNFTSANPDSLFWSTGDGDSMEPTIRSGEVMLIDRSQDTPRMGDGIWAVALGDIGMIKRLRPLPDGTVQVLSDNQYVPPVIASDGELHVIGRVVAVVRRL